MYIWHYRSPMLIFFPAAVIGCGTSGTVSTSPTGPKITQAPALAPLTASTPGVSASPTGPKITQKVLVGAWKAPGGGDFKEFLASFDKDGKGFVRGLFDGRGGLRWEFTYEIDKNENAIKIYQDGKCRGTAHLTMESKLHMKVPGAIGNECLFTPETK